MIRPRPAADRGSAAHPASNARLQFKSGLRLGADGRLCTTLAERTGSPLFKSRYTNVLSSSTRPAFRVARPQKMRAFWGSHKLRAAVRFARERHLSSRCEASANDDRCRGRIDDVPSLVGVRFSRGRPDHLARVLQCRGLLEVEPRGGLCDDAGDLFEECGRLAGCSERRTDGRGGGRVAMTLRQRGQSEPGG